TCWRRPRKSAWATLKPRMVGRRRSSFVLASIPNSARSRVTSAFACLLALFGQLLAFRVGTGCFARHIVHAVFDEGIQSELRVHVLEVILLPPTPKHRDDHLHRRQITAVRHDHRLPTIVA